MGLLGLAVGLVAVGAALHVLGHAEHERLHRDGIHHHHHDRNFRHTRRQYEEHMAARRREGYKGRFGTRKDGRRYRKRI